MQHDDRILEYAALLRRWRWSATRERIAEFVAGTPDAATRSHALMFFGHHAAERGDGALARKLFQESVADDAASIGWARCGEAFLRLRERNAAGAQEQLDLVASQAGTSDVALTGYVHHLRGVALLHLGCPREAVHAECDLAWALLGPDGFAASRVLDTYGQLYMLNGERNSARRFFERSLELKRRFDDREGQALTMGQLGRLALTDGDFDRAESWFRDDLRICLDIGDERGIALMHGHLGRVENLRLRWTEAIVRLDEALEASSGRWPSLDGFARKDRAVALTALGRLEDARAELAAARSLLPGTEGQAQLDIAEGVLRRACGEHDESLRLLRGAVAGLRLIGEGGEAATAALEVARTLHAAAAQCTERSAERCSDLGVALRDAWDLAARHRRDFACQTIESEMRRLDERLWLEHMYERTRGRSPGDDTSSLVAQERVELTALFVDVVGSTDMGRTDEPTDVVATMNDLTAQFAPALERHGMQVSGFLGDGFLAIATGEEHAARSVDAALGFHVALKAFNRPRAILGLRQLRIRVGCNSGVAAVGNVGTYTKIDRTAIGHSVNMAKRVESNATETMPAIGPGTHALAAEQFTLSSAEGRPAEFKGCGPGPHRVWDVVARRP